MDWQNKKILITGAARFIGSYLVEKLANSGAEVRAFVRYNSRDDRGLIEILPQEIRKKVEVVMGDLRDSESVRAAMRDINIVRHLGTLIAVSYSYIHPTELIEINIMGTLNILNVAKNYEVKK